MVSQTAHFTNGSSSLIDVICSSTRIRDISVDAVGILTGHAFSTAEFIIRKAKCVPKIISYRPIKGIDLVPFERDAAAVRWDILSELYDVRDIVDNFTRAVKTIFDLYAPIKTQILREKPAPWLTDKCETRDEAA